MGRAYRAILTGSRNYTDTAAVRSVLARLQALCKGLDRPLTILVGRARGFDSIVAILCREMGIQHQTLGRSAGPKRNQRMIDPGASVCWVFPLPGSRRAWDCARRAFDAGIHVEIVNVYAQPPPDHSSLFGDRGNALVPPTGSDGPAETTNEAGE